MSGRTFAQTCGRLEELASTPVLLVASDYDGTLSPLVSDFANARPHRECIVALRTLASLPHTHVAVISGRGLRDLDRLLDLPGEVHLVGSHGSEFDADFQGALDEAQIALRARVLETLTQIASRGERLRIEEKPASIALHYRDASDEVARRALDEVEAGPSHWPGVFTRHGKLVVELSVLAMSKGRALGIIRQRVGATAVLFVGDDLTDEEAFATLSGPDVGVKVGEGESLARNGVADVPEVARLLCRLAELRTAWALGAGAVPIHHHALLSDQRGFALVTSDARMSWLCLPRLDSPPLFAELLGGPAAGRFTITPADARAPRGQSYLDNSLVLRTQWDGITVSDFLDCSRDRPRQSAGRSDLLRIIEGNGRVRIEFAPRLDFGRIPTRLRRHPSGIVVEGSFDPIVLRAPDVHWEIVQEGRHQTALAEVQVEGEPCVLDLRYGTGSLSEPKIMSVSRRDLTCQYWASWAARLELPPVEPEIVMRSALTLKALCYGPSGAIAAAATTSLPEHLGGVRNWDYRYCWLRDGALSAMALLELGSQSEALHFLDWVLAVVNHSHSPAALRPLYGVDGEAVAPDAEIGELGGYRGSRPVRVGNSAAHQVQLDVFGPIVDLVYELLVREAPLSSRHWRLVEAMAAAVQERWKEPDHGIWELRLPPRHHVHSRTMCWLTLDRAIKIAHGLLEEERPHWVALRDEIAADVLERGWSARAGAFTTAYGSDDLDAAALMIGLSGLVAPTDPRFVATVEAVERRLRSGSAVHRYRFDDGLPGGEGPFVLCASWLVDAYLAIGRRHDAWELFRGITALAGPTGLLSEQYDTEAGIALGNYPQAYSHIGIIKNALNLASAGM
ncbi:MAG TPA: trehalose-phosphatase [Candidatus Limnocylindrales bacterium]|nr:trehalose-phosphatase [Candidatus Limnocylindrales bacterium]